MELDQDTLLQAAEQRLRHLSIDRLRVALDFLTYLEQKEEDEATEELLNIPGLTQNFTLPCRKPQQAKSFPLVKFAVMVELVLTRKAPKFYQQASPDLAQRLNRCFDQLC